MGIDSLSTSYDDGVIVLALTEVIWLVREALYSSLHRNLFAHDLHTEQSIQRQWLHTIDV